MSKLEKNANFSEMQVKKHQGDYFRKEVFEFRLKMSSSVSMSWSYMQSSYIDENPSSGLCPFLLQDT